MFGKKAFRKFFFSWQKSDPDGAENETSESLEEVGRFGKQKLKQSLRPLYKLYESQTGNCAI